jgi:hypothetical protein
MEPSGKSKPCHLPESPVGSLMLEVRLRLESQVEGEPGLDSRASHLVVFHADSWESECLHQMIRALIRDLRADPEVVREALDAARAEFTSPAPFWAS